MYGDFSKQGSEYVKFVNKNAKLELAKLHITIEAQRKDFHFKLINELLKEFDTLCFETLNIKAMQMMWGRKIGDYGYAQFMMLLKAKAQEHGKQIVNIDQWYPSSKTCSCCGHVLESLELKTREWVCPSCLTSHNRDINAANNIKRVGISTLTGDPVRPAKVG
jgi:putative transposase